MSEAAKTEFKDVFAATLQRANEQRAGQGLPHLSIRDIADAVEASTGAVYAWLNGKRQPRPRMLERLAKLLAGDAADEAQRVYGELSATVRASEPEAAGGRRKRGPAFLTSAEIAERQRYAKDLWVFKWNRKFLTKTDPSLYDALRAALASTNPPPLRWHYVFPGLKVARDLVNVMGLQPKGEELPHEPEDMAAAESFKALLNNIKRDIPDISDKRISDVLLKHELSEISDVLALGIPRLDIGLFMIEYTDEAWRGEMGRQVDIFVELEAPEEEDDGQGPSSPNPPVYWVEMDVRLAVNTYERWQPILDRLRDARPEAFRG